MDQSMFSHGSKGKKQDTSKSSLKPEVRQDLVFELDYRAVKQEVWNKFVQIYGGGPAIIREKPDIYSPLVDESTLRVRSQSPLNVNAGPKRAKGSSGSANA